MSGGGVFRITLSRALVIVFAVMAAEFSIPVGIKAGEVNAAVVYVIDGDTIVARLENGKREKVRLKGIDCPKIDEPYYGQASAFTREMVLGKKVKLITAGRGNYGRLLAYVIVDGKSLNLQLVENGLARIYTGNFAPENRSTLKRYMRMEEKAKEKGLGIWKTDDPTR